jgi:1-deoxy-D-xylulose-5-phosphate reductoisomerase
MNLAILGATGSIGASTLDVAARHPQRYRVFALSARSSADALAELCARHRPRFAVLSGTARSAELERRFKAFGTELLFGAAALESVARHPDTDAVMAGIVGAAGLASTLAAVRAGKRVLLANKEALVMAGPLVMRAAQESGAQLLPVDSEHNAVFQCFSEKKFVRKIVLTASGGPFRATAVETLHSVTPDQACAHPNWSMGRKISVDSATMMNKGLEVIEARWLFGLPPERIASGAQSLDLTMVKSLSFETPDLARFPCLALAYQALRAGGTASAVLNAANEVAVEAFLAGRLAFTGIGGVIAETLAAVAATPADDLAQVMEADAQGRREANRRILALAA